MIRILIIVLMLAPSICLAQKPNTENLEKRWVTARVKPDAPETFLMLLNVHETCSFWKGKEKTSCHKHWKNLPTANHPLQPGEIEFFNPPDDIWVRTTKRSFCALRGEDVTSQSCRKEWRWLLQAKEKAA